MSRLEPVLLIVVLGVVILALTGRLTVRKDMDPSMTLLDCRLGYYGLLSLASALPAAKIEENKDWIAVNVADGHFLFSKQGVSGHPMTVRRKMQIAGERLDVLTDGCAFGGKEAYKVSMTNLPPPLKAIHDGAHGVNVQLKADLSE